MVTAAPTPTPATSNRGVRAATLTAGGLAIEKVATSVLFYVKGVWPWLAFLPDSDVPFVAMGIAVGIVGGYYWLGNIVRQLLKREGIEA
jgi:hypothetical protein